MTRFNRIVALVIAALATLSFTVSAVMAGKGGSAEQLDELALLILIQQRQQTPPPPPPSSGSQGGGNNNLDDD